MFKRMLTVGLTLGWGAWFFSGCGGSGSSSSSKQTPTGTLITFIGDSPICDVVAFRPAVTQLFVTPQGGGKDMGVIFPKQTLSPTIPVNLADLRDSSTILNLASVPVGTYIAATITLNNPQLLVFTSANSPPIKNVTVTMSNKAPKGNIFPPLQVTQGAVSVLRLDFDLLQSIAVDALGQVTGNVTPTFHGTGLAASGSQPLAQLENVRGFVARVDTVSSNASFIGDIQMQLLAPSSTFTGAPAILVNLTSTTQVEGISALNQLPTGSFVIVNGIVDSKGNFVANTIEVQDRENVDLNKLAFIGYVLSVTKDSSGNLSQFSFYVHEEDPNAGFSVPQDTTVLVNVSPSTVYQFSSLSTNFANLSFNPAAIVPGQELIVHGIFATPPSQTPPPPNPPPPTVAADKIYLKLQTLQGGFSSLLQAGSDDKTGAFYLSSCATLLQGAPVLVVTNNNTAFVNVAGLGELTRQPTLIVKGLPFFEPQAMTVNGVSVPAGTLVVLAEEVHQLS